MRRRLPILILAAMAAYVGVSCSKDDGGEVIEFEPELAASLTTIALAKEAGSADTFQITSNTDWTVASSESWLAVNPTSGSEDGEVIVTAQENTGKDERTATITISADDVTPLTIEVTQMGVGPSVIVAPKSISVGPEPDESNTFEVTSNTSWTITEFPDWLTVDPISGSGNATITVTTNEIMTVSTARTAQVKVVTDEGEVSQTVNVSQTGFPCVESDEIPCEVAGCSVPDMPTYASLPDNPFLPDPFKFMSGSRMTSKDEWECRRAEIAMLAQEFEFGYKPCTPYEATTASFEDNTITVTVTENGKTISFDCSITYPNTGSAPYPAMIGIGFSSLDNALLAELGVAVISFPNNEIAEQQNSGSRGRGKFYDLHCSDQSAGALMAWAWGISRLVDAIEKTPDADIDPDRLGVTGCSRNGKGALVAGAYDERIVLTIPQESGAGGAASWRVSDYQGSDVQRLRQIVNENCWLRANFSQFSTTVNKLPFDHHMVMALCAPRALLVIENTSMVWLGNLSTWTTGNAAHTVWEAMEIPDKMGFSQFGHGSHCSYPEEQKPELQAYVEKFLVGTGTADTEIMQTDGDLEYDEEMWVDWTVPDLD